MRSVTVLAPAKVNLHLGIYPGRDERGYHRADSVMVALGLADRVTVSETPDSPLRVSMDVDAGVGERDNTAYVAAERLCAAFGRSPEYQVSIEKRVPPQSGLGGSSSDGAATILALCDLWGVSPASDAVVGVARSVGADVPFFLNLAPSLLEGAGDVLRRVFPALGDVPIVLVRPKGGVSTARAYAEFDCDPVNPLDTTGIINALSGGSVADVARSLYNNLSGAARRAEGQIAEVERWLAVQDGVRASMVSGSGSCVFGICSSHADAERIAALAHDEQGLWSCATRVVSSRDEIAN